MALSFSLNKEEEEFLGKQAKLAIQTQLMDDTAAQPLTPPENLQGGDGNPESPLMRPLGVFVTLHLAGRLRGCIGSIIAHEPLYLGTWNMARMAAFHDPRFPPLSRGEWNNIEMEISVLDQPVPCLDADKIEIGKDGLILQYAGHQGLFLPQVPVEQHWDLPQYLEQLCYKAGLPAGSWKKTGAKLFRFQAQVFPI